MNDKKSIIFSKESDDVMKNFKIPGDKEVVEKLKEISDKTINEYEESKQKNK